MGIICNIHRNLLFLCLKLPNTFKMKHREIAITVRSMWPAHSPFNTQETLSNHTSEDIAPCS